MATLDNPISDKGKAGRLEKPPAQTGGFTLVEMVVTLGIFAILLTIAGLNLRPLNNDAQNAATILTGSFKQVRARAMSTTSAYRLVYLSPTELKAEFANTCKATTGWTAAPKFDLELDARVSMTSVNVGAGDALVCFSSRGLATNSRTVTLKDTEKRTRTVEVFLGGAVALQ